jgi:hypothetical protein
VEDNPNSKGIAVNATYDHELVKRMIDEAVKAEREACAKIADEWAVGWPHPSQSIAEWIRKRT